MAVLAPVIVGVQGLRRYLNRYTATLLMLYILNWNKMGVKSNKI